MPNRILTSTVTFSDVQQAVEGNADKLELIVRAILHDAYGLALRYLWHPEDAEDATQEIAIRAVTAMSSFRNESTFRTWIYRIACNTLASIGKSRVEMMDLSFDGMAEDLAEGLAPPDDSWPEPDHATLIQEVKVGCTHAMLICLDREHRLAYILGTILDIDHREAATTLGIKPAAFRKRLSRANARISEFMLARCGIADGANACRCEQKIAKSIHCGRVNPSHLLFSGKPTSKADLDHVVEMVGKLDAARRAAEIYRSHPDFDFETENLAWVVDLFSSIGPLAKPRRGDVNVN